MSSAIDWFFTEEEEGIILEDDCLPNNDFFIFCEQMLERYRDDKRIMHISGSNYQLGSKRGAGSYYFSNYSHIWGWATWRRAWNNYDVDMNEFPNFRDRKAISSVFSNKNEQKRWLKLLEMVHQKNKNFDTWDFQWNFALWNNKGLSIIPNCNLISNIGEEGTHFNNPLFINQKLESLDRVIVHPCIFSPDHKADSFTFKNFFADNLILRVIRKLKRVFHAV